eukprot:2470501-Amphidinium_carterae.1
MSSQTHDCDETLKREKQDVDKDMCPDRVSKRLYSAGRKPMSRAEHDSQRTRSTLLSRMGLAMIRFRVFVFKKFLFCHPKMFFPENNSDH